jgi:hypothetical protein
MNVCCGVSLRRIFGAKDRASRPVSSTLGFDLRSLHGTFDQVRLPHRGRGRDISELADRSFFVFNSDFRPISKSRRPDPFARLDPFASCTLRFQKTCLPVCLGEWYKSVHVDELCLWNH